MIRITEPLLTKKQLYMKKILQQVYSFLMNQLHQMEMADRRRRLFRHLTDEEEVLFIMLYGIIKPKGLTRMVIWRATHNEPEKFFDCLKMLKDQARQAPIGLIESIGEDCFISVAELAKLSNYHISMSLLKYNIKRYSEMVEQYQCMGEEHAVYVEELILN